MSGHDDRRNLRQGFMLADLKVEPLNGRLIAPDGSERHIQPKAMDVLVCLAAADGETVERNTLIDTVWRGLPATDEVLTRCISELRRALHDLREDPQFIHTVPKRGYRLVADVTLPAARESAEPAPSTRADAAGPSSEAHVSARGGPLRRNLDDLRRRKVIRVAAAYPVIGWLLVQVADVARENLLEPLGAPGWLIPAFVVLVVLGYPVALILAYALEVTPAGIRRDRGDPTEQSQQRRGVIYLGAISLAVAAVVLVAYFRSWAPESSAYPANSIAVLPFENLSGAAEGDYFSRGLTEDVLHRLASIEELKVASRKVSFELDVAGLDTETIGAKLRARQLLTGSVRRDEDKVRVTAQLVDTEGGYELWSGSYDRTLKDVFAIQDDIAQQVVKALKVVLSMESEAAMASRPTTNVDAYDYFLQARSFLRRSSSEVTLGNAERFFKRALDYDPEFTQAYAGLCETYLKQFELSRSTDRVADAEQACQHALTLDSELGEVHLALGSLYRLTGRNEEAIVELEAALDSRTVASAAYIGLGQVFASENRFDEAEEAFERAVESDPDNLENYTSIGNFFFSIGRYERAATAYERLLEGDRDNVTALNNLGAAYQMMADFERAAAAYRQVIALNPNRGAYSNIGTMYFYLGRFEDALVMYREALGFAPEDHRLWGNLADAHYQIAGGGREAEEAYQQASELAEQQVQVNSQDIEAWAGLAHYYSRLGRHDDAEEALATALSIAPSDVYTHYYAALVWLQAGRDADAVGALQRAVELGYPVSQLTTDPQLAGLKGNRAFEQLLTTSASE